MNIMASFLPPFLAPGISLKFWFKSIDDVRFAISKAINFSSFGVRSFSFVSVIVVVEGGGIDVVK